MGMAQVIELHPGRARLRVAGEVRAWKGRLRMSQAAIAALLGISQASVSDRLNGKAAFSLDELDVLADHFGIDVADLIAAPVPTSPHREGSDTRRAA